MSQRKRQPTRQRKAASVALVDQLLQGEAILESLVEGTTDAVYVKDAQGRYVLINAAVCRFTGMSRDAILGHDDTLLHPVEQARAIMAGDALIMASGVTTSSEDALHVGGVPMTFLTTKGPVRRADGTVVGLFGISRDITERKRIEQALHESERRYRTLLEWSPVPIIVHRDGRTLFANTAALALYRVPLLSSVIGVPVLEFAAPEHREFVRRRTEAAVAQGVGATTPAVELAAVRADGTRLTVEVQGAVVLFDGAPAMISVARDITEQRAKDAALRESEYFFRESQRVARIGSYRADFVAGTWRSSDVLDQIFGIEKRPEHPISDWIALIHPEDQARMSQYLEQEVIGHGELFDNEYRIVRTSDAAVRWVHGRGELERAGGSVVAMTGTIQDITERRAAVDALRESNERHRAILKTAMDGFLLVDAEGRLREVNDAYAQMSGYSVAELLTMRVAELEAIETRQEIAERIARLSASGQERFETRHRRKDGSTFDIAMNVQVHGPDGGQFVAFIQDVSARKRAEAERAAMQAQLQQAQKMESVGRLAGGVAHDFNNMLGVILGYVDIALQQVATGSQLREDLEEVRRVAVRSVELTRQLLAFARRQNVAPKVLDLNATVAGMMKMLERLIGEDITIDWKPQAALWPVRIDPSQVDQILANLCVNSRDAIVGPGRLVIETAHRRFTARDLALHPEATAGEYVQLSVSDNGAGMSEETMSHLFEPFYTTKALGKGTGLGLATVWGIVRQNDGFIDVSSSADGTSFRIYVPRYEGEETVQATEVLPLTKSRGRETILLTEDEPGILALAARMLEQQGYHVLRARSPEEAMRIAGEHAGKIHLLVTDVVMPVMNGSELAQRLLALYPSMKRLFMSGYAADVAAHGVLDSGMHFLPKPFSQEELLHRVRETLDEGRSE